MYVYIRLLIVPEEVSTRTDAEDLPKFEILGSLEVNDIKI